MENTALSQQSGSSKIFDTKTLRGRLAVVVAGLGSFLATGCEKQQASPPVPRPTFSTLVENQERKIGDIPKAAAARESLKKEVDDAQKSLGPVLQFDEKKRADWIFKHEEDLNQFNLKLSALTLALDKAVTSGEFSGQEAKDRLSALRQGVKNLQPSIAGRSINAETVASASDLNKKLSDLSLALDWDLRQLAPGIAAPQIIAATETFANARKAFERHEAGLKQSGMQYLSENQQNASAMRATVSEFSGYVGELKGNMVFKTMSEELDLLHSSLNDLAVTLKDPQTFPTYWSAQPSQASGGELLVRQVSRHVAALEKDFRDELSTIGVQERKPATMPVQVERAPHQPQTVVVHHNSGSNMFLWWYLMSRGGRDYSNHYYVPAAHYAYSGPARLHSSSPLYSSYLSSCDQSYAANGTKPGLSNQAAKSSIAKAQARAQASAEAARASASRSGSSARPSSGFGGGSRSVVS